MCHVGECSGRMHSKKGKIEAKDGREKSGISVIIELLSRAGNYKPSG